MVANGCRSIGDSQRGAGECVGTADAGWRHREIRIVSAGDIERQIAGGQIETGQCYLCSDWSGYFGCTCINHALGRSYHRVRAGIAAVAGTYCKSRFEGT